MNTALDRLAELVRQAESKTKAQRLGAETHQAAERLAASEERMKVADRHLHEIRPIRLKDLEQADADESLLKELMKKLAQAFASLEPGQQSEAEDQIKAAKDEIQSRRNRAQSELEAATREAEAARKELKAARDAYQSLRKELDQILPHLAPEFTREDRLAREAELFFPSGQMTALAREIDDGERHFGMLDQREQFAQLKIWIGRYRRLQATVESGEATLSDEDMARLREIFPRLVGISKQYMPGYIEAFSRSFETDWDAYIAEASELFRAASEQVRLQREIDQRRRDAIQRDLAQKQQQRASGLAALDELRASLAGDASLSTDEALDAFNRTLERAVAGLGMSDPLLLDLLRPHVDLLTGSQFRGLRRNLERVDPDQARQAEIESQKEQYQDLLPATRGLRALMIGGDIREEKRRILLAVFDFDDLEWVPFENARPAMLKSLEQRVRNRSMDLVLILKEFVGHNVSESLRPLCEENGIPCLFVEHGYGAGQVAEALRKGFARLVVNDAE
jgi:hypothetical protein